MPERSIDRPGLSLTFNLSHNSIIMPEWEVKLIKEPFEQRREEYESESIFALIMQSIFRYDREALGQELVEHEDWGCIDPPGPIGWSVSY